MDKQRLSEILEANKVKGFVKRILNPDDYPLLANEDGTYSTHSMTWGQFGDKYRVFPTVLYTSDGEIRRYSPEEAWGIVGKAGNFIEFDTSEEADEFSREYKQYWD